MGLKQSSGAKRLDIQGLRAIAVIAVVVFHAELSAPGGFVGVDVFFVISGFVITAMLLRERSAHGRIRLGRFYLRRFKRLTPALAVTVAVTILVAPLFLSPVGDTGQSAQTAVGAMLFVSNGVIERVSGDYFDPGAHSNPLLHVWSLSVEEQFYFVFPLVLAGAWLLASRWPRLRWVPLPIVGALAAVSFGLTFVPAKEGLARYLMGYYGPVTRAFEFGAGALLALLGRRGQATSRAVALPLAAVGLVALAASMWLISGETHFPGPWTLLPVSGTMALIAAGSCPNPISSVLSHRWLVALGDWSYSIYLWHWPLAVYTAKLLPGSSVALAVSAIVSIVFGWASFRFLEDPIRAWQPTRMRQLVVAGLCTFGLPLLLAGVLGYASTQAYWSPVVEQYRAARQHHIGKVTDCGYGLDVTDRCVFNAQATGSPIYILGDSTADSLSEGILDAAERLGRPMRLMVKYGCSYGLWSAWEDEEDCSDYQAAAAKMLDKLPPGTVVISSLDHRWSSDVPHPRTPEDLTAGLDRAIARAQSAGHSVLVVPMVPRWGTNASEHDPLDCSVVRLLSDSCRAELSIDRVVATQGAAKLATIKAADQRGAATLELWPQFCREGSCRSYDNGFNYRDSVHISVAKAHALSDLIEDGINRADARAR